MVAFIKRLTLARIRRTGSVWKYSDFQRSTQESTWSFDLKDEEQSDCHDDHEQGSASTPVFDG
jgi:hypothetical protein